MLAFMLKDALDTSVEALQLLNEIYSDILVFHGQMSEDNLVIKPNTNVGAC